MAVWGVAGASFVLGLPLLSGVTAFAATTSLACAGLALTYGLPLLIWILNRHSFLEKGLFTLGRCGVLFVQHLKLANLCNKTLNFFLHSPTLLPPFPPPPTVSNTPPDSTVPFAAS